MLERTFFLEKSIVSKACFKKVNFLIIVYIVITGCEKFPSDWLKSIKPVELNQLMQQQDVFLVDVHIPEQRHIKGTDAFVPFDNVTKYLERFPSDKNTPIYLYCEGGSMGESAAKTLYKLGYHNVTNLEGGARAWLKNGYAFE